MRMHHHTKEIPESGRVVAKTTKPAGKWIVLGQHHVIPDHNGKILASIFVGAPNQAPAPITAFVGNKQIGTFISEATARKAIMRSMGNADAEEVEIIDRFIKTFQRMREEAK